MGKYELIAVSTILIVVSANLVAFLLVFWVPRHKRKSVEVDRGSRERIIQSIRTHLSSLVENEPSLQASILQAVLNTGILDGLCNGWCSTAEFNDLLFDAVDAYGMNLDLPDDVCGSIGEDYDRLHEMLFGLKSDAVFRKHLSGELLKVYWAGYLLGLFHFRFYVEHGKAKGDLSYALWGARPSVFVKDEMPDQVFRRGWSDGFNARLMI